MNALRRAKPTPSLRSLLYGGAAKIAPIPRPPPPSHHAQRRPYSFFTASSGAGPHQWRRSYYANAREVQHFRRRRPDRWYHNPRAVLAVAVVGGGSAVAVYYGNIETVPYTKRTHFVLLSPAVERQLGESQFQQLKESLRGKLVPAIHPDSVRVRLIAKDLIAALQRGLRHAEPLWRDMEYAADAPAAADHHAPDARLVFGEAPEEVRWGREDERLDDEWVHHSRRVGEKRGAQPVTRHLEGLNWEVVVVRDNMVNAMCLPGGKIIVFTGLLDHFRTDAEIATVIGHEVGHAIARHAAEGITKNLGLALLQIIALQFFYMPDLINAMSNLLLRLPFSRRMEMEADYIGLLLLASAGYDPRVAPKVYEKLGQITKESALNDYLSTHPSSKKRAQLLSQARVMEEALMIYREAISGRGVEGFL